MLEELMCTAVNIKTGIKANNQFKQPKRHGSTTREWFTEQTFAEGGKNTHLCTFRLKVPES